MKIVEINTVCYGSTGRIMLQIAQEARARGYSVNTFSMPEKVKRKISGHAYWGTYFTYCVHYVLGKATGGNGLFSIIATKRLIKTIKQITPEIIHLHNLHGFCINLPILFSWLKKNNIKVVWTLHDCWSFTGHCPHYAMVHCEKWKTGCYRCPEYRSYPQSNVDNSRWMWKHKQKWFSGLNATIITPSQWLADQVKQSFLKDYPLKVISNGIDLMVFKPVTSDFRERYRCQNKKIVLGVAFGWGVRKGLDVFVQLAERLPRMYQIVLVGTDERIDKQLPRNIISIHRTQNQQELAQIYSAADVFANPTREEVLGLVNIEALACGTPVVTFDAGGSPECIDTTCGIVVPCDDIDAMEKAIRHVCEDNPFFQEACVKRASCFDKQEKFEEYVELYEQLYCNT